jgi:hypothetical protein
MYASEKRNVEVVRALLMGWVDIRPLDRMGNTAKDLATGGAIYSMLKHRESQKTLADNSSNRKLAFLMASHPLAFTSDSFPGSIAGIYLSINQSIIRLLILWYVCMEQNQDQHQRQHPCYQLHQAHHVVPNKLPFVI